MKHSLMLTVGALVLAACATATDTPEMMETPAAYDYSAALTGEGRTEEDMEKDANRMPAETLAFFGVEPGDIVLEMEAGGGYFTPLLAEVVGADGKVYMQNPPQFAAFWGGGDPPRLASLPTQVGYLASDFDDLSALEDGSVDVVTWIQGPHEIWYQPDGMDHQLADPNSTFEEIARVLKDGGVLVVQDHAAPTGSEESTGGTTHRIDPNHIDKLAASKGLEKVDSSDLFANPDDDGLTNVFDPSIRGKTDQFLIKYQK